MSEHSQRRHTASRPQPGKCESGYSRVVFAQALDSVKSSKVVRK